MFYLKKNQMHNLKTGNSMRQIIWPNFAITELKNIFLYYRMLAGRKTADKMKKSIFSATKPILRQPFIGAVEENLIDLK